MQDLTMCINQINNDSYIALLHEKITKHGNTEIVLLRNKEVLQWIFGDLSFLPDIEKKNKTKDTQTLKALEDIWGQNVARSHRPDLKLDKQWTTTFGQQVCHEIYTLIGKTCKNPRKKENFQPDKETEDEIIEVKTQTYNTTGTAGEKILGVPYKYRKIPELYGKPLKILTIGCAEKECRDKYSIFSETNDILAKEFLTFYKSKNIEYIAATDLLRTYLMQD